MAVAKPVFIHYGLAGGASCSCILDVLESSYLVVGTVSGLCKIYSTLTHLPVLKVYDDPDHRSIIAVGQIKPNYLFVHIRSYAVILLKFSVNFEELKHEVEKLVLTKHYGFCRTISHNGYVYVPLYNETENAVKIINESYNERELVIRFEDDKQRGMLMSFNITTDSLSKKERFLICCFEEGTIAVFDIELSSIVFFTRAFTDTVFACSVFREHVAVGSVKNMIKMYRFDSRYLNDYNSIPFPSEAAGCASLCFSPCGKFLASGYWDGSIRVHSVKSSKILVFINFHKDTIDFLDWRNVNGKKLLYASCKSGALSVWNLLKN